MRQGGANPAIVPISLVLTLSKPKLAADHKSVRYAAKRIYKTTPDFTKLRYKKPTVLVLATPKKFGTAVLNIDNGSIKCPTKVNTTSTTTNGVYPNINTVTHHNTPAICIVPTNSGYGCMVPPK